MNESASTGAARPGPLATERPGDVAVLWLDRAPANALDAGLIAALGAALAAAGRDAGVAAVLIAARGPVFSAGADPEELRRVKGAALPGLCLAIEAMAKPVVAVLQGNCLGAGLELALHHTMGQSLVGFAHTGSPLRLDAPAVAAVDQRQEKLDEAKESVKQKIAVGIAEQSKEMDKISDKLEKAATELARPKKSGSFMDILSESVEQLVEDVVIQPKPLPKWRRKNWRN